jgi:hypothetical protein
MRLLFAAARLPLKITAEIASRAMSMVGLGGDGGAVSTPVRVPPEPRYVPTPPVPRRRRTNGGTPPPAAPRAPAHVSEEPVLVAEVAEAGAEEGAGAEIHIEEPWPGYDRMTAADIRDRLRSAPKAVAAAVSLYEASRKGRTSVLEAAARGTRGSA